MKSILVYFDFEIGNIKNRLHQFLNYLETSTQLFSQKYHFNDRTSMCL